MTFYPAHFFAGHRKRLIFWLGGLLTCAALASSAGATEIASPAAESAPATTPTTVPGPATAPAQKPRPRLRPVAVPAAAKPAASTVTKTAGTQGSNALVQVADGRLLAPDIARIVARGELIVAMLGVDTPPFFFENAGVLSGLEVNIATDIANELKVKVRFDRSAKNFNQVIDIVARQQADLGISKLSRTLARAQVVRLSEPYLTLKHALVFNRVALARLAGDQPVSQVVRNFSGTIGVIADSSFADFALRNFPSAKIRPYSGWPEVIKAVSNGEVMSAYRDEFEIKRILKSDPTFALTLRTVTLKDVEDTLGIAVGVADPTLLAFVNQFLAQRNDKLDIKKVLQALDH